ncbi:MAG: phosphoglycerate kinase [Candidatus Micrarchaeota archaeon]|nr:phosphoglycerate kinase [Candidatus Micrarchaeota archaeon]
MAKAFLTMDYFDFAGKTVLVRADLNSSVDEATGKVQDSERIKAHAKTIKELAKKKARVVVLAHQGRAGDKDFTHLDQHAELLSGHAKKKVKFVPDVIGPEAVKQIQKLKDGRVLLLDNVRLLAEETLELAPEEHAKSVFVRTLAPLAQVFVNDAYSVAHRPHCSVVGFAAALPSCAGRVMEEEIDGNEKAREQAGHPNVYILGGAKPDDCVKLLKAASAGGEVDKILVSGVIGELCLIAKGLDLGKSKLEVLEKNKWLKDLPAVKEAVERHGEKIEAPLDLAVSENGARKEILLSQLPTDKPVYDIGSKTALRFAEIIRGAKSVYVKGPLGKYEDPAFELGTKLVFEALAKSKAFSLVGGGHTLNAMEKFGVNKKKIGHISLAGGALLTYLTGASLPGVEALKKAAQQK